MDQRRWGIVLIAVVLLGLFVTSNLRDRTIDGVAVAEPVPGPPQIGDCVTAAFDPQPPEFVAPEGIGQVRLTAPETAPCTDSRYGEVIRIYSNKMPAAVVSDLEGQRDDCFRSGYEFVGVPLANLDTAELRWYPTVQVGATLIGPGDRQSAAGQQWMACVVHPREGEGQDSYKSTLRDAVSTGVGRDRLGLCTAGPSPISEPSSCRAPHVGQIIANGISGRAEHPRHQIMESCERLMIELTGSHLTADESLRLRIEVIDPETGVEPTENLVRPESGLMCLVETIGDRQLTGGLIGLGDRPIPWA